MESENARVSVSNFQDLQAHYGHKVEIVNYRDDLIVRNVAVECVECFEVIVDFDAE